MSFLKPNYKKETRSAIVRGGERGKRVMPVMGGLKKVGAKVATRAIKSGFRIIKAYKSGGKGGTVNKRNEWSNWNT